MKYDIRHEKTPYICVGYNIQDQIYLLTDSIIDLHKSNIPEIKVNISTMEEDIDDLQCEIDDLKEQIEYMRRPIWKRAYWTISDWVNSHRISAAKRL